MRRNADGLGIFLIGLSCVSGVSYCVMGLWPIVGLCAVLLLGGAARPQTGTWHLRQVNPPDANPQYFPRGVFHKNAEASDWFARWYAKYLRALEEPSLFEKADGKAVATYRLLLVSSFRRPVVIQLEVRANGTGLLTAKMTSGIHGELGPVLRDESEILVREQVDEFLSREEKANFWTMPTGNMTKRPDGSEWILEGRSKGAYHVVDRWSPPKGEEYFEACSYLIALSPVRPDAPNRREKPERKRDEGIE